MWCILAFVTILLKLFIIFRPTVRRGLLSSCFRTNRNNLNRTRYFMSLFYLNITSPLISGFNWITDLMNNNLHFNSIVIFSNKTTEPLWNSRSTTISHMEPYDDNRRKAFLIKTTLCRHFLPSSIFYSVFWLISLQISKYEYKNSSQMA